MKLYYLIYTSEPARMLTDLELKKLLDTAREANVMFEVTGMLICLPESYIQLIEGPKNQIEQLYQNIQRDQRHLRINILREGSIDHRFFPEWSMAFKKHDLSIPDLDNLNLEDNKVVQLFDIMEK